MAIDLPSHGQTNWDVPLNNVLQGLDVRVTTIEGQIDDGNVGIQGSTGSQGIQGRQGPTGRIGDRGLQGVQGVLGVQGPLGPQGTQGVSQAGPQGIQGGNGPQGRTGAQGLIGVQGPKGTQGTLGIQGVQGWDGPQGPTGSQGVHGTQGLQGTQGTQGVRGSQGTHGTQGAQGAQGSQGTQGVQGTTGIQGETGIQGTQGAQGEQGVQGAQGLEGLQGIVGPQGLQGTQGTQGVQGVLGLQGIQGVTGTTITILGSYETYAELEAAHPSGSNGDSYLVGGDLYVWEGSAWDNVGNIRGPQGTTGAQGLEGLQGLQGLEGLQGAQGLQGLQGTTGEQGLQGTVGAQGLEGAQGFGYAQLQGTQGTQGTSGAQGPQGLYGIQGTSGAQGIQGIQGAEIGGTEFPVATEPSEATATVNPAGYKASMAQPIYTNTASANTVLIPYYYQIPKGSSQTVIQKGTGQTTIDSAGYVTAMSYTTNASDGVNPLATSTFTGWAYGNGKWLVRNGTYGLSYSTDGTTWTAVSGISLNTSSISFGNGKFVVTDWGAAVYYTSTDAITWTTYFFESVIPNNAPTATSAIMAFNNGLFYLFGYNGTSFNGNYVSTDAVNWTLLSTYTGNRQVRPKSVSFSGDKVIYYENSSQSWYLSKDRGVKFSPITIPNNTNYFSQSLGIPTGFLVFEIGDFSGTDQYSYYKFSTDGINWQDAYVPSSPTMNPQYLAGIDYNYTSGQITYLLRSLGDGTLSPYVSSFYPNGEIVINSGDPSYQPVKMSNLPIYWSNGAVIVMSSNNAKTLFKRGNLQGSQVATETLTGARTINSLNSNKKISGRYGAVRIHKGPNNELYLDGNLSA